MSFRLWFPLHLSHAKKSKTARKLPARTRKKSAVRLSKDGKWRSFPRFPHLLQYVSTCIYFARLKIRGTTYRERLKTMVWTNALLKLADFIKDNQSKKI